MKKKGLIYLFGSLLVIITLSPVFAQTYKCPDFAENDNYVNYADFLVFVDNYGSKQGEAKYDSSFDLDSNGEIAFSDFLLFIADFNEECQIPTHCTDNIKSGDEDGIDCGGSCPKICNLYYEDEEAFCTPGDYSAECPPGSCVVCPNPEYGITEPACFDVSNGHLVNYPDTPEYKETKAMIDSTIGCFNEKWDICGCFDGPKTDWQEWMLPWDVCDDYGGDFGTTRPGKKSDGTFLKNAYVCARGINPGVEELLKKGKQLVYYTKMAWFDCEEIGKGVYAPPNWYVCTENGWENRGMQGHCNDGIRNGNEEGIDCGGSCTDPCFQNTNKYYDEDEQECTPESVTQGCKEEGSCVTCDKGCISPDETYTFRTGKLARCFDGIWDVCDADDTGVIRENMLCDGREWVGCSTANQGLEKRSGKVAFACKIGKWISSCENRIQDNDETGIDCGGSCDPCENCWDGIKNQGEEGVDCGGSCRLPCFGECEDGTLVGACNENGYFCSEKEDVLKGLGSLERDRHLIKGTAEIKSDDSALDGTYAAVFSGQKALEIPINIESGPNDVKGFAVTGYIKGACQNMRISIVDDNQEQQVTCGSGCIDTSIQAHGYSYFKAEIKGVIGPKSVKIECGPESQAVMDIIKVMGTSASSAFDNLQLQGVNNGDHFVYTFEEKPPGTYIVSGLIKDIHWDNFCPKLMIVQRPGLIKTSCYVGDCIQTNTGTFRPETWYKFEQTIEAEEPISEIEIYCDDDDPYRYARIQDEPYPTGAGFGGIQIINANNMEEYQDVATPKKYMNRIYRGLEENKEHIIIGAAKNCKGLRIISAQGDSDSPVCEIGSCYEDGPASGDFVDFIYKIRTRSAARDLNIQCDIGGNTPEFTALKIDILDGKGNFEDGGTIDERYGTIETGAAKSGERYAKLKTSRLSAGGAIRVIMPLTSRLEITGLVDIVGEIKGTCNNMKISHKLGADGGNCLVGSCLKAEIKEDEWTEFRYRTNLEDPFQEIVVHCDETSNPMVSTGAKVYRLFSADVTSQPHQGGYKYTLSKPEIGAIWFDGEIRKKGSGACNKLTVTSISANGDEWTSDVDITRSADWHVDGSEITDSFKHFSFWLQSSPKYKFEGQEGCGGIEMRNMYLKNQGTSNRGGVFKGNELVYYINGELNVNALERKRIAFTFDYGIPRNTNLELTGYVRGGCENIKIALLENGPGEEGKKEIIECTTDGCLEGDITADGWTRFSKTINTGWDVKRSLVIMCDDSSEPEFDNIQLLKTFQEAFTLVSQPTIGTFTDGVSAGSYRNTKGMIEFSKAKQAGNYILSGSTSENCPGKLRASTISGNEYVSETICVFPECLKDGGEGTFQMSINSIKPFDKLEISCQGKEITISNIMIETADESIELLQPDCTNCGCSEGYSCNPETLQCEEGGCNENTAFGICTSERLYCGSPSLFTFKKTAMDSSPVMDGWIIITGKSHGERNMLQPSIIQEPSSGLDYVRTPLEREVLANVQRIDKVSGSGSPYHSKIYSPTISITPLKDYELSITYKVLSADHYSNGQPFEFTIYFDKNPAADRQYLDDEVMIIGSIADEPSERFTTKRFKFKALPGFDQGSVVLGLPQRANYIFEITDIALYEVQRAELNPNCDMCGCPSDQLCLKDNTCGIAGEAPDKMTFYVDPDAADGGLGTQEMPFKTINEALAKADELPEEIQVEIILTPGKDYRGENPPFPGADYDKEYRWDNRPQFNRGNIILKAETLDENTKILPFDLNGVKDITIKNVHINEVPPEKEEDPSRWDSASFHSISCENVENIKFERTILANGIRECNNPQVSFIHSIIMGMVFVEGANPIIKNSIIHQVICNLGGSYEGLKSNLVIELAGQCNNYDYINAGRDGVLIGEPGFIYLDEVNRIVHSYKIRGNFCSPVIDAGDPEFGTYTDGSPPDIGVFQFTGDIADLDCPEQEPLEMNLDNFEVYDQYGGKVVLLAKATPTDNAVKVTVELSAGALTQEAELVRGKTVHNEDGGTRDVSYSEGEYGKDITLSEDLLRASGPITISVKLHDYLGGVKTYENQATVEITDKGGACRFWGQNNDASDLSRMNVIFVNYGFRWVSNRYGSEIKAEIDKVMEKYLNGPVNYYVIDSDSGIPQITSENDYMGLRFKGTENEASYGLDESGSIKGTHTQMLINIVDQIDTHCAISNKVVYVLLVNENTGLKITRITGTGREDYGHVIHIPFPVTVESEAGGTYGQFTKGYGIAGTISQNQDTRESIEWGVCKSAEFRGMEIPGCKKPEPVQSPMDRTILCYNDKVAAHQSSLNPDMIDAVQSKCNREDSVVVAQVLEPIAKAVVECSIREGLDEAGTLQLLEDVKGDVHVMIKSALGLQPEDTLSDPNSAVVDCVFNNPYELTNPANPYGPQVILPEGGAYYSCNQDSIIGDIDGDERVTEQDADIVMKMVVDPVNYNLPDDICCIDANKDGRVTTEDAIRIGSIEAGAISGLGRCASQNPVTGSAILDITGDAAITVEYILGRLSNREPIVLTVSDSVEDISFGKSIECWNTFIDHAFLMGLDLPGVCGRLTSVGSILLDEAKKCRDRYMHPSGQPPRISDFSAVAEFEAARDDYTPPYDFTSQRNLYNMAVYEYFARAGWGNRETVIANEPAVASGTATCGNNIREQGEECDYSEDYTYTGQVRVGLGLQEQTLTDTYRVRAPMDTKAGYNGMTLGVWAADIKRFSANSHDRCTDDCKVETVTDCLFNAYMGGVPS